MSRSTHLSFKRLIILWKKELLLLWREPLLLLVFFSAMTLQLILFGYAADSKIQDIPMIVWNADGTQLSRDFLESFQSERRFQLLPSPGSSEAMKDTLQRGGAVLALKIPSDFSKNLSTGRKVELEADLDGAQANVAAIAEGYLYSAAKDFFSARSASLPEINGTKVPEIHTRLSLWFNPELQGSFFMVPGVIGAILALIVTPLSAAAFAREKESGTLASLQMSPVQPLEFLLGKGGALFLVSLVASLIGFTVGVAWFQLPLNGSLTLLALATHVFILFSIFLGFLSARVSRSQFQAMLTCVMGVFPELFLSGVMVPTEHWPWVLRMLNWVNPLYYFVRLCRGALVLGQGWSQNGYLLLLLSLFTLALFGLSVTQAGNFFIEVPKTKRE